MIYKNEALRTGNRDLYSKYLADNSERNGIGAFRFRC